MSLRSDSGGKRALALAGAGIQCQRHTACRSVHGVTDATGETRARNGLCPYGPVLTSRCDGHLIQIPFGIGARRNTHHDGPFLTLRLFGAGC